MPRHDVVLVSMPWNNVHSPSIQLGILAPLIASAGLSVKTLLLNLSFFEHVVTTLGGDRFPPAEYAWIGNDLGLGEWVFAVPPFMNKPEALFREEVLSALAAKGYDSFGCDGSDLQTWFLRACEVRRLVPGFLDDCARRILSHQPKAVGFTICFQQTVPSLALARELKARAPDLKIVFGGSNCEGVMGEALHRLFPYVDVVVRGEGESVAAPLFRSLADRTEPPALPGLCVREGSGCRVHPVALERGCFDESPTPEYDEYFSQLSQLRTRPLIEPIIPIEFSRGCWWGEKLQCTFCGRDRQTLSYRKKSGDRILREVRSLAHRHGVQRFRLNDDVIDDETFEQFIAGIREEDRSFTYYTEIRANQTEAKIIALKKAGFARAQPGIESLSTPILKLMRKGTTALQNVKLLKWSAQHDLRLGWNFLYGFPGEPPAEYQHMARFLPALTHLHPPIGMSRVSIVRFSPYFRDPDSFGLTLLGPSPLFRVPFEGVSETDLFDLGFAFDYRHTDERYNEASYVGECRELVDAWRQTFLASYRELFYTQESGTIEITDRREATHDMVRALSPLHSALYLACEDGATASVAWNRLSEAERGAATIADAASFLETMVAQHLAFKERDIYLSLALKGPVSGSA